VEGTTKGDLVSDTTTTEVIGETTKWTAGLGILLLALAPLSLPILALTAVALVPLAVPVLVLGLLALAVVAPIRLMRRTLPARRGRPTVSRPPSAAAAGRP
jgi:hypothetical protein